MSATPRTPWQQAAAVAEHQRGLITARQALLAGLSRDQCDHAVRVAGWHRLARGLFALPGSDPTWQRDALAACLLAGRLAVAADLTAAALWGWCSPPPLPEVAVPHRHSSRTPLVKVHRRDVPLVDQATRQGIRCTSASRTLVDLAGRVERSRLQLFVDDALCGGVATAASVAAASRRAGRRGRAGMAALDGELAVWSEDITPGSPAEMRLLRRLGDLGAVDVVTQHEIHDDDGFIGRVDVAVLERKQAFEYDSDRYHNPRWWARDEPRYARLRAAGWRADPVCKLDLLPSSTRLAQLLQASNPVQNPERCAVVRTSA